MKHELLDLMHGFRFAHSNEQMEILKSINNLSENMNFTDMIGVTADALYGGHNYEDESFHGIPDWICTKCGEKSGTVKNCVISASELSRVYQRMLDACQKIKDNAEYYRKLQEADRLNRELFEE